MPKKLAILGILTVFFLALPKTGLPQTPQDYIIGAGDIMEIVTWKEPDFSREDVFVRLDGKITFPLLGDIQAAGKTPMQVKSEIQEKLGEYVAEPEVTITIRSQNSKRFYILGEVVKTGEYPLIKNLTVLQAFAVAGGFTEWASKKEILLFRRSDGKDELIRINYKEITKGNEFERNLDLKEDDTIIVP
jgi:polysaccharide export outer membrane protein